MKAKNVRRPTYNMRFGATAAVTPQKVTCEHERKYPAERLVSAAAAPSRWDDVTQSASLLASHQTALRNSVCSWLRPAHPQLRKAGGTLYASVERAVDNNIKI